MKKISDYPIGIIGAGFGGIIAAMKVKDSGRGNFIIFEKAASIGGTWRDNTYPGCACDVPSYVYSIKEAPKADWSRMFSPQPEILAYMQDVVDKNRLEKHIQYNAEIVKMVFLEAEGIWELTDQRENKYYVKAIIAALGPLNRPKFPEIKGIDAFKGAAFHTSEWNHDFDLKGKKVAIIGTGASAIQVLPAIAPIVEEVTIFQRTAAWISDRKDHTISEGRKRLFGKRPGLQKMLRNIIYEVMELRGRLFIGNKLIHRIATRLSLKKLRKEVNDPKTREQLTPKYKLGCKRILSSDDYLPSFNRENVKLVTNAISEITEKGLKMEDGQQLEFDALIYATGFLAAEISTSSKIVGLKGREMFAEWEENGMEAHRGTTFSGYPNLMYVLGPNTGLGHSSVLHIMESQMPYMLEYLDSLDQLGPKGYMNVRQEAQASYNSELQSRFKGTVWESGCKSWYLNSKGKNTTLYPRLTREFRKRMAHLDKDSYQAVSQ